MYTQETNCILGWGMIQGDKNHRGVQRRETCVWTEGRGLARAGGARGVLSGARVGLGNSFLFVLLCWVLLVACEI